MSKTRDRHDEACIKARLLTEFRARGIVGHDTIVASEYGLLDLGVRADLALLDDAFVGVEVKSALDSTRRLHHQMSAYLAVFDKVVLVVPPKHMSIAADPKLRGVEIWQYGREGSLQPIKSADSGSPLLDRMPLLSLIPNSVMPKLHAFRLGTTEQPDFALFKRYFSERFGPTSQALWHNTQRRDVTARDLSHLSRYAETRQRRVEAARRIEDHWEKWRGQAERVYA